ncbi:cellulose binding domain-containing protein [Halomonas getboli]|uniref:cellulose binding domain-containing protein n=1 Tax=Halomonas getboli TaxID=2935862 RepID=UPI001FFF32B9|nr:cellulose binding domain-containing protein [Halomonas getboli]MCK2183722.1 cellulose binding domain-containing protein [Halomonas getboli]
MSSTIEVDTSTSAAELESLIRNADAGTSFRLSAGEYRFDDSITVERSDISLMGAGADETRLTFTDEALSRDNDQAIHLDGSENVDIGTLSADADSGDRRLTLEDDPDLSVGDTVRLWQDNDDAFFDDIGDSSWRKVEYAELRTSMAKVTDVDGDQVTLDRGVRFDFSSGETRVERLDSVDNVTLKGFSLGFELGESDLSRFENVRDDLSDYHAVHLEGTVNARLDDIQVIEGPSTAFRLSRALDTRGEDLEAHGAFNKGSNGNGYAYELHESYDGVFSGLEDSGMRHGLVFASWRSSAGNEVEIASTDRDVNFHGGRDHDNSVHVRQSIRDPEADELSPALYVNEDGESFGAPTDPDANEVVFDYLIGTRREDGVQGSDDGVYLNGGLGHDRLYGGSGNDLLQGGPGDDWYDGDDRLDGGEGVDTARYTGHLDDHEIAMSDDGVIITGKGSEDTLTDVEFAVFGDGTTLHTASGNLFRGEAIDAPEPGEILDGDGTKPAILEDDAELLVTGNVTSQWSSGYVAEVFVENVSDDDIVDPQVGFDLPADLDTLWNGVVGEGDGGYRVQDNNANTLAPGEAWRFSFKAYGDDALPAEMSAETGSGQALDVQVLGLGNTAVEEVAG